MIAFIVIAGVITWEISTLAENYFKSSADISTPVQCAGKHSSHLVVIKNGNTIPQRAYAPRCDTLIIENEDDVMRLIAFGPHTHHTPYDGITEKLLGPNQSITITLNTAGTYHFHDHTHDEVTGEFTVSP